MLMNAYGAAAARSRATEATVAMTGCRITRLVVFPKKPRVRLVVSLGLRLAAREPEPVDLVAEQAEQSGKERQGKGDGDEHDCDGADGHALEDRGRDDEQSGEGDDYGDAREKHRAAGGLAGGDDRIHLHPPAAAFLAEAFDDEEGVIDADGEADHRDDVEGEAVYPEHFADRAREADSDEDAEHAEYDRHAGGGGRAEDDYENDERGRDADHLGGRKVLLEGFVEFLVDAAITGGEDGEALAVAGVNQVQERYNRLVRVLLVAREGHGRMVLWWSAETRLGSLVS